jgi:RND family efflux transporter MFP subunit
MQNAGTQPERSTAYKAVRIIVQIFIALILVGVGFAAIMGAKPEPKVEEVKALARNIRFVKAEPTSINLAIDTQGSVMSKQHINLVPQVSGQVTYVSSKFVAGGRFKKGDVILRIDPRDYEVAVISAESRVVGAEQTVTREKAESQLAQTEWAALGQGQASDLTLRIPQMKQAIATLKAAQADLSRAKLNLERATIRAPFDGLLGEKMVDFGQYLSPGMKLGSFYSTSTLEIRLPLANRDLSQLDLVALQNGKMLDVTLTGNFANQARVWKAKVVRSEGLIDQKSRILYVVAEISGAALMSEDGVRLNIGQFVKATIQGRQYDNVLKLPRGALRQGDRVLVMDSEHKLRTKMVDIIEVNNDYFVISADDANSVKIGDIVNLSQLGIDVDGLLVSIEPEAIKAVSKEPSSSKEASHE